VLGAAAEVPTAATAAELCLAGLGFGEAGGVYDCGFCGALLSVVSGLAGSVVWTGAVVELDPDEDEGVSLEVGLDGVFGVVGVVVGVVGVVSVVSVVVVSVGVVSVGVVSLLQWSSFTPPLFPCWSQSLP
jgi:hypothetical protein